MITDEMIRTEFIAQTVKRDMDIIYATQENVVREVFKGGTGRLASLLSTHPFGLYALGVNYKAEARILPYLRFLDIKYRKQDMEIRSKLALYNRVVWGVLYNETLPDLRYGFTQEIRKKISQELRGIEENKQQMSLNFET